MWSTRFNKRVKSASGFCWFLCETVETRPAVVPHSLSKRSDVPLLSIKHEYICMNTYAFFHLKPQPNCRVLSPAYQKCWLKLPTICKHSVWAIMSDRRSCYQRKFIVHMDSGLMKNMYGETQKSKPSLSDSGTRRKKESTQPPFRTSSMLFIIFFFHLPRTGEW